jgi:hypothetical protein
VTLTIHTDIVQRSDEWYELRRGMITTSAVGRLITPKTMKPASNQDSRSLASTLAAERISGWTDSGFVNDDMMRGIDSEPILRAKYAQHYAPVTEVAFMTEDRFGFKLGLSPDGLVGEDGLIEIKCPRANGHIGTIIAGHPPIEYMAQLQCALLVSGREWIDYVSFCAGLPLYVKRVTPQPKWFDAIRAAASSCEDSIREIMRLYHESAHGLIPTERITNELVF